MVGLHNSTRFEKTKSRAGGEGSALDFVLIACGVGVVGPYL